jgi:hypothetical protein
MIYRIKGFHGGLGDQLQFSTLPERLTEMGHEVYLLHGTEFRNDEIKQLCYDLNPFIKGQLVGEWNLGDIPGLKYENKTGDFIKNWEVAFGLDPINESPVIYYKPKEHLLKDKIIIDLSGLSLKGDYTLNRIMKYINRFNKSELIQTMFSVPVGFQHLITADTYQVKNIFDYCDLINSCGKFICLFSGGNSVASALKRNKYIDVDCLMQEGTKINNAWSTKLFVYKNINYIWI